MIRFNCTCGQQLQAREENAGKVVLCPACKQRVTVPSQPSTSIQPEEPNEPTPPQRVQRERPAPPDENEMESDTDEATQPVGSSGKAVTSLVLGILSLFCNVLAGLPAVLVGIFALRDIGRSRDRLTGRGMAMAGIITALVGTMLSCVVFTMLLLPALLLPAVQKVREAATKAQSQNNLKQMALAMHNYNDANNGLPPAGIGDPSKRPAQQKALLSWRVAILPYIEQISLYKQFKLDEPWDSPNNIKLLGKMPKMYQLPGDDNTKPDHTHYQVFVGNGAAFDKTKGYRIPGDFRDGTSNTILIVEAENAVPWTKPEDVPFDPSKPVLPLMSRHFGSVFHVALADGSVRSVVPQISEQTFKAAITRNGNEVLGPDW